MGSIVSVFQSHGTNGVNGTNETTPKSVKTPVEVPVLIVGGGPTGLLQAILLSKLGVKCLIVERYPQRLPVPKAHALSPRSLEICRQFGLDLKKIRSLGTPRRDAYYVNFITDLSGEQIGVLPYERMDPEVLEETPEMIHNIPQPMFEDLMTEFLQGNELVEIRKGISFVSLKQEGDKVITTVEERATGIKETITSRHVIACDGRRSRVRSFLGIESEGEDSYETMMTIHFNADLRPVVGDRVGMLHWIADPEVSGFIIAYDLSGNQVLICNFDSKKHPVEKWTEQHCRTVLNRAIGKDVKFDVLSFRPWILSRKVANQYRVGNVFLAGDAAHSFPPTGGLGLNSGLGDVHNLAYRIAAVHQGWGGDALLDSYESDRTMVANINSKQSVKNGQQIFALLKSLGTAGIKDPEKARENLYRTIHDPSKQEEIQKQIRGQTEHFDNLELHIGYVYGSKQIPPNASDYKPKFIKGARLPHAWISFTPTTKVVTSSPVDVSYVNEFSEADVAKRKFSTLDMLKPESFTIITNQKQDWEQKVKAVMQQAKTKHVHIEIIALGEDFGIEDTASGTIFLKLSQIQNGRSYLVRPDQHILDVFEHDTTAEDVSRVLTAHLGL